MFNTEEKKFIPGWLLNSAIIFFIVILLLAITVWVWEKTYENKIYPGVFVAGIDLSGKTADEAEKILNQKIDSFNQRGIDFKYKNQVVPIMPIAGPDADLAYGIINFDANNSINDALAYGRDENFFINIKNQISSFTFGKRILIDYFLDKPALNEILTKNFAALEAPAEENRLLYDNSNGSFSIKEQKPIKVIEYDKAIKLLDQKLSTLDFSSILLTSSEKQLYNDTVTNDLINQAYAYLDFSPLTLKNDQDKWVIEKQQLAKFIDINPKGDSFAIGLNQTETEKYLKNSIAAKIDVKPLETKFQLKDGRVTQFQAGKDGLELDIQQSIKKITNDFIGNKINEIDLAVRKLSPFRASSTEDILVKELIGTGHSSFAGSSKNRRTNIRVGADSLNGLLIKPGETFSIMKALGDIDGGNGYLQELVIKGNKTVPEYGGGLCQIGTTMFRTALASGLPIAERRNHSYRVSYYEPAGTDATIYDPSPDLKFTNDTGNLILIQARISGNDLYFDFWGTKDGRTVKQTYPTIYNIVKPKTSKIIETLSLPKGQKKCTEKAHNGADAYFDYKVTYDNGEIKNKRFTSHYVPWQEVCLIGVDKLSATSTKPIINTATSTPSNTSSTTATVTTH